MGTNPVSGLAAARRMAGGLSDYAMRGPDMSDLSIIKAWEVACAHHPRRRVRIWSLDQDLQGYDREPRCQRVPHRFGNLLDVRSGRIIKSPCDPRAGGGRPGSRFMATFGGQAASAMIVKFTTPHAARVVIFETPTERASTWRSRVTNGSAKPWISSRRVSARSSIGKRTKEAVVLIGSTV